MRPTGKAFLKWGSIFPVVTGNAAKCLGLMKGRALSVFSAWLLHKLYT